MSHGSYAASAPNLIFPATLPPLLLVLLLLLLPAPASQQWRSGAGAGAGAGKDSEEVRCPIFSAASRTSVAPGQRCDCRASKEGLDFVCQVRVQKKKNLI